MVVTKPSYARILENIRMTACIVYLLATPVARLSEHMTWRCVFLGAGVPAIPQFSALTTWFVLFLQLGSLFGMHCEGCVLFGVWYIVEAG